MRRFSSTILSLFLFLPLFSACHFPVEDQPAFFGPYARAVGLPFYPAAGRDSSMDACLSIVQTYNYSVSKSERYFSMAAAFNDDNGYTGPVDQVRFGDQILSYDNNGQRYNQFVGQNQDSTWHILNYAGISFDERATFIPPIQVNNNWDTVHKTGFTLHYVDSSGEPLHVFGQYFLFSPNKLVDSAGALKRIDVPANGSITFTTDDLKNIPSGAELILNIVRDNFYSKYYTQGRKIGFYSQTESVLHFIVVD